MDRRATTLIGTRVSNAIAEAGGSRSAIAEAIGLTSDEMNDRLRGDADFSAPQLVRIGGLLHVPASSLLRAAA